MPHGKQRKKKKKNRDMHENMILHIEEAVVRVRKKNCDVSSRILSVVVTYLVINITFCNDSCWIL